MENYKECVFRRIYFKNKGDDSRNYTTIVPFASKYKSASLHLHAEVVHDESIEVGLFFKHFCQRLAAAVTCLSVNTYQHGVIAFVTVLQFGCELEGMGWHYPIVVVGSHDQRGGIVGAGLEIVQR